MVMGRPGRGRHRVVIVVVRAVAATSIARGTSPAMASVAAVPMAKQVHRHEGDNQQDEEAILREPLHGNLPVQISTLAACDRRDRIADAALPRLRNGGTAS